MCCGLLLPEAKPPAKSFASKRASGRSVDQERAPWRRDVRAVGRFAALRGSHTKVKFRLINIDPSKLNNPPHACCKLSSVASTHRRPNPSRAGGRAVGLRVARAVRRAIGKFAGTKLTRKLKRGYGGRWIDSERSGALLGIDGTIRSKLIRRASTNFAKSSPQNLANARLVTKSQTQDISPQRRRWATTRYGALSPKR